MAQGIWRCIRNPCVSTEECGSSQIQDWLWRLDLYLFQSVSRIKGWFSHLSDATKTA